MLLFNKVHLKSFYSLHYIFYWNKIINFISTITFKKIPKKILEFGIVGCLGIIIQLILFYILNYFHKSFINNNAFAVIAGTLSGYYLNNLLTFNKNKLIGRKFILGMIKFLTCSLLTISLNIYISSLVYNILKINFIAIFAGISCGFFSNFFISRKLVWKI
tara:strand:+ start:847 stop:1329 length:483 start_codon:yes stop_codon:yes gene_type:complete